MNRFLLVGLLVFAANAANAGDVAAILPNVKAKYLVETDGAGGVLVVPLDGVGRPGQSPTNPPPTEPPPVPVTKLVTEVERLTNETLASGGTKTTGAGIATVYSIVSDGVNKGTILPADALEAIRKGTNLVLAQSTDESKWIVWRESVGRALTDLKAAGSLETKAQLVSTFNEISAGMNKATGFKPSNLKSGEGILDGINIEQIIKLITLLMELFKMFAPKVLMGMIGLRY